MTNDKQILKEASLGRINQHLKGDRPVGIITAFRGEETEKTNVKNNKALASVLKKAGYGFFWVDGAWIENEGEDNEEHVSEVSIFVIGDEKDGGNLKKILTAQAKKYKQDGFVYKDEGTQKVEVLDKTGKVQQSFAKAKLDTIATYYTKLRGKGRRGQAFVFVEAVTPAGFMAGLAGNVDGRGRRKKA